MSIFKSYSLSSDQNLWRKVSHFPVATYTLINVAVLELDEARADGSDVALLIGESDSASTFRVFQLRICINSRITHSTIQPVHDHSKFHFKRKRSSHQTWENKEQLWSSFFKKIKKVNRIKSFMLFSKSHPLAHTLAPTCSHDTRIRLASLLNWCTSIFLSVLDSFQVCCNLSHPKQKKKSLNSISPSQRLLRFYCFIVKLIKFLPYSSIPLFPYFVQPFITRLLPHNSTLIAHVKVTLPTAKYNGQSTCKQHWT